MIRLLPKLEELFDEYKAVCLNFQLPQNLAFFHMGRLEKKITKIKNKIDKLYIGNKANARNVLLPGM